MVDLLWGLCFLSAPEVVVGEGCTASSRLRQDTEIGVTQGYLTLAVYQSYHWISSKAPPVSMR